MSGEYCQTRWRKVINSRAVEKPETPKLITSTLCPPNALQLNFLHQRPEGFPTALQRLRVRVASTAMRKSAGGVATSAAVAQSVELILSR